MGCHLKIHQVMNGHSNHYALLSSKCNFEFLTLRYFKRNNLVIHSSCYRSPLVSYNQSYWKWLNIIIWVAKFAGYAASAAYGLLQFNLPRYSFRGTPREILQVCHIPVLKVKLLDNSYFLAVRRAIWRLFWVSLYKSRFVLDCIKSGDPLHRHTARTSGVV